MRIALSRPWSVTPRADVSKVGRPAPVGFWSVSCGTGQDLASSLREGFLMHLPAVRPRRPGIASTTSAALALCLTLLLPACMDEADPVDWEAQCAELVGGECLRGCVPVVSTNSSTPERPCGQDGVLFGCAPHPKSDFWSNRHDAFDIGRYCARSLSDPQYIVCFEGLPATWWVRTHLELFCQETNCPPQTLVCDTEP